MSASILDQLTLGYRLLWSRQRQVAAIELFIDVQPGTQGLDAAHLLQTLAELWPAQAPPLLLSVHQARLLHDLLAHASPDGPWLRVPHAALADAVLRAQVQQAHARGLQLVWHGHTADLPGAGQAPYFARYMHRLDARQALHAQQPARQSAALPMLAGDHILDNPPNHAVLDWALDQQQAWAVAGWPMDDILDSRGTQPAPIWRTAIARILRAISDDASLDQIEHLLGADPLLAYHFLRHANDPELGLRSEIESIHRALMVMGLGKVENWLLAQLPNAADEPDFKPVRALLVLRAQLQEHVLDPGEEEDLRREVYLCGLLSQIDRLLGEPLETCLQRLPLSERVQDALLRQDGPYYPALAVAIALESSDAPATRELCQSYGFAQEDVNRALLRTLSAMVLENSRGRAGPERRHRM